MRCQLFLCLEHAQTQPNSTSSTSTLLYHTPFICQATRHPGAHKNPREYCDSVPWAPGERINLLHQQNHMEVGRDGYFLGMHAWQVLTHFIQSSLPLRSVHTPGPRTRQSRMQRTSNLLESQKVMSPCSYSCTELKLFYSITFCADRCQRKAR